MLTIYFRSLTRLQQPKRTYNVDKSNDRNQSGNKFNVLIQSDITDDNSLSNNEFPNSRTIDSNLID